MVYYIFCFLFFIVKLLFLINLIYMKPELNVFHNNQCKINK